jgi:hypothetical protein
VATRRHATRTRTHLFDPALLAEFAARTTGPTGLARIGSPRSQRDRSSDKARALGYRRPGSFSRHFRQITSRSRDTRGFSRDGDWGSWVRTMSSVSASVVPANGARPVSIA